MRLSSLSLIALLILRVNGRFLEDAEQMDDAVNMQNAFATYGKCVRVKVKEDNDDDGNSYFYNGAYHSQTMGYASVYICDSSGSSSDQCGVCDKSVEYVMDLADYLQQTVKYVQAYCSTCQNECLEGYDDDGNGNQDDDTANIYADCDVCVDHCTYLTNGNDGTDETEYLDCQAAYMVDDIQVYSGPTCNGEGQIVMGLFYDEYCTIKHANEEEDFSATFAYNTFLTIESMCYDCSNGGLCQNMVGGSITCDYDNSQDDNGDVCSKYSQVSKEWQYADSKAHTSPWVTLLIMAAVILVVVFTFLSYTYFVRHNSSSQKKEPLILEPSESEAAASTSKPEVKIT